MSVGLRLFREDDVEPLPVQPVGAGFSAAMSLTAFGYAYYFPSILKLATPERVKKSRNASEYRTSLRYWAELTGDPPLHQIDDTLIDTFEMKLSETAFGRTPTSKKQVMSDANVVKHLKNIRAILYRAGPPTDPKRPKTKNLLASVPHIVISSATQSLPKRRFSVQQARRLYACCEFMSERSKRTTKKNPGDGGPNAPRWWRAFIATAYYTGLRRGTLLELEWSMITEDEDGFWLAVPGRIVRKTRKPSLKALRAEALQLIEGLPRTSEKIFPWAHTPKHLLQRHRFLQRQAGIKPTELRDFHAWKRTHVKEVGRLGIDDAMNTAQRAGDHSDRKTTRDHYCNLDQETAAALQPLVVVEKKHAVIDPTQRNLF